MKRLFFILGILLAIGPAVFSQAPDDIVSVEVVAPAGGFTAGRTVQAALKLTIRPPFHINSGPRTRTSSERPSFSGLRPG